MHQTILGTCIFETIYWCNDKNGDMYNRGIIGGVMIDDQIILTALRLHEGCMKVALRLHEGCMATRKKTAIYWGHGQ